MAQDRSSFCRSALAFFVLIAIAGCGSEGGLVPVTGVVTMDGEPVTEGRIEFFPQSGRPASGVIRSDGRYSLTTYESGDGAKPGEYVVTVTARQTPNTAPMYKSMEDELMGKVNEEYSPESDSARVKWLVPKIYSNRASSGLTAEVDGGGEIDFQLQSKSKL